MVDYLPHQRGPRVCSQMTCHIYLTSCFTQIYGVKWPSLWRPVSLSVGLKHPNRSYTIYVEGVLPFGSEHTAHLSEVAPADISHERVS